MTDWLRGPGQWATARVALRRARGVACGPGRNLAGRARVVRPARRTLAAPEPRRRSARPPGNGRRRAGAGRRRSRDGRPAGSDRHGPGGPRLAAARCADRHRARRRRAPARERDPRAAAEPRGGGGHSAGDRDPRGAPVARTSSDAGTSSRRKGTLEHGATRPSLEALRRPLPRIALGTMAVARRRARGSWPRIARTAGSGSSRSTSDRATPSSSRDRAGPACSSTADRIRSGCSPRSTAASRRGTAASTCCCSRTRTRTTSRVCRCSSSATGSAEAFDVGHARPRPGLRGVGTRAGAAERRSRHSSGPATRSRSTASGSRCSGRTPGAVAGRGARRGNRHQQRLGRAARRVRPISGRCSWATSRRASTRSCSPAACRAPMC